MLLSCQLHSSINQKLFEKQLCNQSSRSENSDEQGNHHVLATTKSTLLLASKDE